MLESDNLCTPLPLRPVRITHLSLGLEPGQPRWEERALVTQSWPPPQELYSEGHKDDMCVSRRTQKH
jgi:hypothetical protein